MSSFAHRLLAHAKLGSMVAHHRQLAAREGRVGVPERPLPARIREALKERKMDALYTHQARAIDLARDGHDVLLATPTASGKTLAFASVVFESMLEDPDAKALFLYPTKALAQDQITGLRELARGLGALDPIRFEIYDGDTPASRRRKIKAEAPHVIITNPDMLHYGILAHHDEWQPMLAGLRWVVIDEMHVYRGIFGANVHHILARLRRLCRLHGARPSFIGASATVGNSEEFAKALVGREFQVLTESGAPQSERDVIFLNPGSTSPYTVAVQVIAEAIHAGQRSITFTKARRITELLHNWLLRHDPSFADRIAPYRAGYLPEERRQIESRLFRGDLMAVMSTSALELGIDVGGLDVCVLVGYPGSLISSWQRIGRVGRQGRPGTIVMIAMPDSLDQYIVHHPELFFGGEFERAVLDPWNPYVAGNHLVCAAAEHALDAADVKEWGVAGRKIADDLVSAGRLVRSAEGEQWFSFKRRPQRDVNPRSAGRPFEIVNLRTDKPLGSIDGSRVYHECHPGAIYLHGGRSYCVRELDTDKRRVIAEAIDADYYTVVLGDKETEILERLDGQRLNGFPIGLGRLKVTVCIREFQKKRLFDGEPIGIYPLDVPPLVYETVGFWIELPPGMPRAFAEKELHFMGGIHATEHAMIGLFPLLAIADRGDIGGISYTGHPQTEGPAIFIYDGIPGGAGLARQGFDLVQSHLKRTLDLVAGCACEVGCPACIQSPKCGNGNKPLDKQAAILTMQALLGDVTLAELGVTPSERDEQSPLKPFVSIRAPESPRRHGVRRAGNRLDVAAEVEPALPAATTDRTLVFDLETQRSAAEVGGWDKSHKMGLALAVVYDVQRETYTTYYETDVDRLLLDLVMAERVVGFNVDRFDLAVLSGYTKWDLSRVRTLDMLVEIHRRLGFRLSLQHLSEVNLGESKSGDGLQSLQWWKEGRLDLIESYCRKDVEVTRRLYDLGREQKFLLYRDHQDRKVRVPVEW